MGIAKRLWEAEQEQGYSVTESRFVCPSCVSDQYLSATLRAASEEIACSYCGNKMAANMSVLLDEIVNAIAEDHDDPGNVLPYESREGGYQGTVYDQDEILEEIDEWTECERLRTDVADALLQDAWCKKDYFSLNEYEVLKYGWERFTHQILHRTRYLFLFQSSNSEYDEHNAIPPARMLKELGDLFCDYRMFRKIEPGDNVHSSAYH